MGCFVVYNGGIKHKEAQMKASLERIARRIEYIESQGAVGVEVEALRRKWGRLVRAYNEAMRWHEELGD